MPSNGELMRRVVDELFVARLSRRMSVLRAAAYAVALLLLTFVPMRDALRVSRITEDGHAKQSLNLAINRALCRQPSALSRETQLGQMLLADTALADVPIREVISARWGSIERYCETVTAPAINNENSLMLTEAWALRLADLSVSQLSAVLLALQAAMLAVTTFALLRAGASALLCAGVLQLAIAVLLKVRLGLDLSVYPFMMCLIALFIAMYVLVLQAGSPSRFMWSGPVLGVLTAYAANMRTSYLPIYVAFFMVSLAGALTADSARGRRGRIAAVASGLFAAGYLAFHYSFIPTFRPPGGSAYPYHVLGHPLVLSLAVPNNALAEREGIRWNDSVALSLARRVDPSADDMRPGYDTALLRYYFSLWRRYPGEMLHLYIQKWRLAGTGVVETARRATWNWTMTKVLAIEGRLTSGFRFLAVFVLTASAAFAGYLRTRAPLLVALCLTAAAGALLLTETAIIMPSYAIQYHQSLLLVSGALVLAGAQAVLSLGVVAVERAVGERRPRVD